MSLPNIQVRLAPLRQSLLEHEVYARIDNLAALRVFMQHHVFAVWDFMSLLKTLQRRLSCVDVPWLSPADGANCRLVNEIVLGEESDENGAGGYASHFELYHRSMERCGANTRGIDRFLAVLQSGSDIANALVAAETPDSVRRFVSETFDVIESGDLVAIAATFTFGREDLLPDLFRQIVVRLSGEAENGLDYFRFYLERHIDLDGDQHGPMAERLVASLCGDDPARWQGAEEAAVRALESRQRLWDGVVTALAVPR